MQQAQGRQGTQGRTDGTIPDKSFICISVEVEAKPCSVEKSFTYRLSHCSRLSGWLQPSKSKLFQMLKHGRAGVPMEVMGLMLGDFVDEYTIHVIDVFAMPQSGTTVSVESVDHVFQTKMVDMLKQTGR